MILLIDSHDSFSHKLYQLPGALNPDIRVVCNNEPGVSEIVALNPGCVIISPGPGRPEDVGNIVAVARELTGRFPILGVCLGHQAICAAFDATVTCAKRLMRGKQSDAKPDMSCPLFAGLPHTVPVSRYHFLAADPANIARLPEITAMTTEARSWPCSMRNAPPSGYSFTPNP